MVSGFFGKASNASGTTHGDAMLSEERMRGREDGVPPLSPYNIHKFLDQEALMSS